MDSIKIFRCPGEKPSILLMLSIDGQNKFWIIQNSTSIDTKRSMIAFQLESETFFNETELELIEEGSLGVEYNKEKKINFSVEGIEDIKCNFIFYIPSWGYHTNKKIWVLIPVLRK